MKSFSVVLYCVIMLAMVLSVPCGAQTANKHEKFVIKYEGTASCGRCHKEAVKNVVESLHYQQAAEPQFLEGWEKGKVAGMMVTY